MEVKKSYTHSDLLRMNFKIPHNLPYPPCEQELSNYEDRFEILLNEFVLIENIDYTIEGEYVVLKLDSIPMQSEYNFEIKAYIDLNLFMKIYTCKVSDLSLYLTSADHKERALAELRYKQLEGDKRFIQEIKEIVDENK